jgi:hypothetical protein
MTEAIQTLVRSITPVWWVVLVLIMLCGLVAALRSACLRLERALRDMQDSIVAAATRAGRTEMLAQGPRAHERAVDKAAPERSLPEGWNKSEIVWTDDTVQRLREWVLEHPDEARVWRIANPAGFSLWAEPLGPDVIRRVWPEDFPTPAPSASRIKPVGR